MAKTVKLADIAQKAGVSTVTVSKALSGQKGVSEEMRNVIKKLSDEMGYIKTNEVDKDINNRSHTVGVIVAERYLEENQSFYWQVYQEVSQNAMKKNYFTILEVINLSDETQKNIPKVVIEQKIEVLIIMGAFSREYLKFLKENVMMPLIYLDTLESAEGGNSVVSNNMMGAYCVTNYLFEMGHSKIGFVGTRLATTSIDDRYFGYLKALLEHGIEENSDWIIDDRDRILGRFDIDKYFQLPKDMPTAFFCNCDLTASYLIRKLLNAGYRVPEDVSVAGFDNFLSEQLTGIGITTYETNIKEMARVTVKIVSKKLENRRYASEIHMITGHLIERKSVKKIGRSISFV